MRQDYDLTTGSIAKKLILYFIPIAVGTLFQQLYNTIDAMVVGKFVGTEALAAVGGSASQIIALFIGFFVALTGGASAVIAQLAGAKQEEQVSKAMHSAFLFSILAGLFLTLVGIPMTPTVLGWMKTPEDTMAQSVLYLRIYFGGSVFMLLFNMGSSILQALGDSKSPLYFLIACCFCNIVLDLVFVVVFHMGIAGVAWATVLSQALSSILIMIRFVQSKHKLRLRQMKLHMDLTRRMLRIGIPTGLQACMYSLSNLMIQVAVNELMTVAVAAWSIGTKVDGLYTSTATALGVAITGFVGQNYGAGRKDRVRETVKVSLRFFLPMTVLLGALVLLFGWFGLGIFTDDPEVIRVTWLMLICLAPFYIFWTFVEVISGSLRGIGDAVIPTVITGIGICLFRLLWVWMAFPYYHDMVGLTICYPISWLMTAIALTIHYHHQGWFSGQKDRD